ncbi:MAG: ABC transporter ATP-binding protein [Halobacteria archaeon]|nr:ABC transporter ATP-binding protein [Halobacteria archaeon]
MLEIKDVHKSYVSFELGPLDLNVGDEVLSVLGPSGCGKTTLLSVIAGIIQPDGGTITLNGKNLNGLPPEDRGTVLVFQDGALFPHMTARENIEYAADSMEVVKNLSETLEISGILDQKADTLSGGEGKRVALARSIAADPDALLLDEPLANLDTPIKRRLRSEMRDLLSSLDIPVIYVTHDQHDATVIGDRIAIMNDGEVHQVSTPTEVFERPETRFVASFTGNVNLFPARIKRKDGENGLLLEWSDNLIEAPDYNYDTDEDVWFCIRPEYVMIADGRVKDRKNVLEGEIRNRVFEGDGYTLHFVPRGLDQTIQIKLATPVYERLGLAERDRIEISLKKEAIHVLER